ncbi:MAG: AtpZ/AtpI family protein [Terriglobales bacterium]
MPDPKPARSTWAQLGAYSGLATLLPACTVAGYAIGYFLDAHFHTGKFWQVVGVILGVIAGMVELIRVVARD